MMKDQPPYCPTALMNEKKVKAWHWNKSNPLNFVPSEVARKLRKQKLKESENEPS